MDIELHYRERGAGEPFIFLHGNGEDGSYFQNQMAYFQNEYRVTALDTRGHGRSPRGGAPFTIKQFFCDLYDFMRLRPDYTGRDSGLLGRGLFLTISRKEQIGSLYPQVLDLLVLSACAELFFHEKRKLPQGSFSKARWSAYSNQRGTQDGFGCMLAV